MNSDGKLIEDQATDGTAFGAKHAAQYLESDGASVDHPAAGSMILLYTTGRSSGITRRTPLRFFPVDDGIVVAASAAGSDRHPDWYLNLLADPEVWVRHDADLYPTTAVVLEDEERDRIWDTVVVVLAPNFASYQEATGRVIPVVRLGLRP